MTPRSSMLMTISAAALLLLAAALAAHGQALDPEKITRVKAAYLLNFVKYTDWPSDSFENDQSPIVITVVGRSAVNDLEQIVAGQIVHTRRIEVQRVNYPPAGPDGKVSDTDLAAFEEKLKKSHLVYMDAGHAASIPDMLKRVEGANVLTVSDAAGFCERGGMLRLAVRGSHVEMDANPGEINKTRVKVSSKVLRLARIVETQED